MPSVLACKSVSKDFGGVRAVHNLTFEVAPGEIFGIAGPNGAGKTTLFNLISGHIPQDSGYIELLGRDIGRLSPNERFRLGIARTFQIPQSFDSQSVLENVLVGAYFGGRWRPLALKFPREALEVAIEALRVVGLESARHKPVRTLPPFDKKRLMIASGIAANPSILMLDEPFGGLNRSEMEALEGAIRGLNTRGMTIIVIEHVLRALFALSARVLIMHHGEQIFLGPPREAMSDERVIGSYLGERAGRESQGRTRLLQAELGGEPQRVEP